MQVLKEKSDISDGLGLPDPTLAGCLAVCWLLLYLTLRSANTAHTPPEEGVRTKKKYITFDIISAVIYQGEQKFMVPGNVGLGLFAQLQKFQVKCQKKP